MLGLLVSAAVLCLIMFVVARHEADYSFPKVILISFCLGLCNFVLSLAVGPWIALVIVVGLTVWALHQFCYLRWGMAGIVTAIYIAVQILLALAQVMLSS